MLHALFCPAGNRSSSVMLAHFCFANAGDVKQRGHLYAICNQGAQRRKPPEQLGCRVTCWRRQSVNQCMLKREHFLLWRSKKMPTNPNAVTENAFVKQLISTALYIFPLLPYQCRLWTVERGGVQNVECVECKV